MKFNQNTALGLEAWAMPSRGG